MDKIGRGRNAEGREEDIVYQKLELVTLLEVCVAGKLSRAIAILLKIIFYGGSQEFLGGWPQNAFISIQTNLDIFSEIYGCLC